MREHSIATDTTGQGEFPVVARAEDFDRRTGSLIERLIFNHRILIILAMLAVTVFLGWHAGRLAVNANFERMMPGSHPWVSNYLSNKASLVGLGNTVRIVVENSEGDIFDRRYLETLRQINDALYLVPGVDRAWVKSLWMPIVRWMEVTESGAHGGPVMPENYDGSPQAIEQLRANVMRAGIVGSLVADDLKSSIIVLPLLGIIAETGRPIDYGAFNRVLKEQVSVHEEGSLKIHIVGFAKLAGDLIDHLTDVAAFFGAAVAIATALVLLYTRCLRSTLLLIVVSLLGVLWLLGLMHLFGYELDPYLILVPFLIFAIGLSHGAQKMNGIMQDIGRGTQRYVAARYTFRRLFLAGLTGLLTNAAGFAVLMAIDVPAIRDLAVTTSMGVTVLLFTKLILIPVLLSYTGVSPAAAARFLKAFNEQNAGQSPPWHPWKFFERFTQLRWARAAVVVAAATTAAAFAVSLNLKVGDLDKGAPELQPDSRYNRDVAFVNDHYHLSGDEFAVMVNTPHGGCESFETLTEMERLAEVLRELPGVESVTSAADGVRQATAADFEANPKWMTIPREPNQRARARNVVLVDMPGLSNNECAVSPVIAYLVDHKAETLASVAGAVAAFATAHDLGDRKFLLAAGNAGIEAATNAVVKDANIRLLILLYSAVALLCFVTFRNARAVIVALIPLLITSLLCEAMMVWLGIGIKVATLPVIALGIGVGIDYALYLVSVQLAWQRRGASLTAAYRHALAFTGKVVAFVGLTMTAGVLTWAWSPIKFQADMGVLLAFMFLWNMLGSLILIPALSHFVLQTEALTKAGRGSR